MASADDGKVDARAVHERLLTLDTHLDTPLSLAKPGWDIMQRHDFRDDRTQVDYPRLIEGGLDGGFFAIFTRQGARMPQAHLAARDLGLKIAVSIREMVASHSDHFALALTADDAARIVGEGKRVVYISMENGYPIGQDVTLVQAFYELGMRMLGPVHSTNNALADSSTDPNGPQWGGLSPIGKQVIEECNRLGIVIDASHASDQAFDQMLALSRTPIMLSHTSSKAIYDHPRNIDDERLRKLAAAGGVLQMNMYGGYLAELPATPERSELLRALRARYGDPNKLDAEARQTYQREWRAIGDKFPMPMPTREVFMAHLLHVLKVAGVDHVGLGADWDGGGGVVGMIDVAGYHQVTADLLAAGYSEADLAKIWSGNTLRVLRQAEQHARTMRDVK
jgi:membrane dipeptidase